MDKSNHLGSIWAYCEAQRFSVECSWGDCKGDDHNNVSLSCSDSSADPVDAESIKFKCYCLEKFTSPWKICVSIRQSLFQ